ncbi:MAG: ABC transporter permease [Lachnospiraceae bacterium]|jgi:putative aldouronate transport system permease protein
MKSEATAVKVKVPKNRYIEGRHGAFFHNLRADILRNRLCYLLFLPILIYFIIFHYLPIFGVLIAFEDFKPRLGILHSPWVGWKNFETFFHSIYFGRLFSNTLILSLLDIVFCFPAPIIFALLLNEVRHKGFKKTVQTISYMPYFLSSVVVCSIFMDFCRAGGVYSVIAEKLTGQTNVTLIGNPDTFRLVYILLNLWQGFGYGSIIYMSTLSYIDSQLYEAAALDGASRWQQTIHVTLPGLKNIILFSFLMRISSILSVSVDKILLLYSPATYKTADVLGTYIYRVGIAGGQYGLTAAVGLLNSVIGFLLLIISNRISRKFAEFSLF